MFCGRARGIASSVAVVATVTITLIRIQPNMSSWWRESRVSLATTHHAERSEYFLTYAVWLLWQASHTADPSRHRLLLSFTVCAFERRMQY